MSCGPHLPSNLWVNKRPSLAMVKWSLLQQCEWKQDKSSAGTTAAAAAAVYYNLIDTAIKAYSIVTFSAVLWVTQHAKNHFPLWASPRVIALCICHFLCRFALAKSVCQIRRKMGIGSIYSSRSSLVPRRNDLHLPSLLECNKKNNNNLEVFPIS